MKWYFFGYLVFYFGCHSLLAHPKVKDRWQRYRLPPQYYRLFYNAVAIFSLFPLPYFYFQAEPYPLLTLPVWGKALAGIGSLVGSYLLIAALRQYSLGEFGGWAYLNLEGLEETTGVLQTQGWNARVRHPLYFAGLWLVWSSFFLFPNDLVLGTAAITTLYIYLGARLEEQKLLVEFGEAYREYQQKVPMLVPRLNWPFYSHKQP